MWFFLKMTNKPWKWKFWNFTVSELMSEFSFLSVQLGLWVLFLDVNEINNQLDRKNDDIRMLENEIKLYEADSEQSIEAQMNDLAELEVLNQSKSASAGDTITQMAERTNMLRKIFKLIQIFNPFCKKFSIFIQIYHYFWSIFGNSQTTLKISRVSF